ncbi:MAG: hypothetical protein KDE51_12355 [Anaerolineales bacterium]|nr:hypothetical protein [Anaerolineales bacterium]
MFTADGSIASQDESYTGTAAIRDAHEYDEASQTLVAFRDFVVEGNVVYCTFWNEHALSRAVGDGGMSGKAAFTFHGDLIYKFDILPPERAEIERVMSKASPAFKWLRENHPEAVAKWRGFDREAGEAVTTLAELWLTHKTS